MGAVKEWLNKPIARKYVLMLLANDMVGIMSALAVIKKQDQIITRHEESDEVAKEMLYFLIDHADDVTLNELDKKMDFWRVVHDFLPGRKWDDPSPE
jgi:hypothetical protein